jgi:RimJ/RimL family protein N-acetyltransferase
MIHATHDIAEFVSDQLGFGLCPPYVCMGLKREDGTIHAGIILNGFEGRDIRLTAAGTGWTREFLREVGRYVFDQLGCDRITVKTESEGVASMAVRLGGQVEGRLRSHFGPGRDAILVGILRDEYRWCKINR